MFARSDARFASSLSDLAAQQPEPSGSWLARATRKRIIVHTRNDQSIEGVLMECLDDGLILRAARLLGADGKQTTIAGEVFVPRENVAFTQRDE